MVVGQVVWSTVGESRFPALQLVVGHDRVACHCSSTTVGTMCWGFISTLLMGFLGLL